MPELTRYPLAAALLTLAACAAPPPPAGGYRDPKVMIASAATFDPARLAGEWYAVADAAAPGSRACRVTRESWTPGPGGIAVTGTACAGGRLQRLDATATVTGPGRFAFAPGRPDSGTAPVWLVWADYDARILALGTPDGSFALVLSRTPAPRADLYRAATEILAFNGYDPARIRPR